MPRSARKRPAKQDHKAEVLDRIVAAAGAALPAARARELEPFLRAYYEFVPAQDIEAETPENLFGAALAHWKLAGRRTAGRATVRVYNPSLEEHGWSSDCTVVEVVTDDMRFLVESLSAELNRLELTVHLTVHPVLALERDAEGKLQRLAPEEEGGALESFMHFRVTQQSREGLEAMREGVEKVLASVRAAVEDWAAIREHMAAEGRSLQGVPGADEAEADADEVRAFLQWLYDHNFTFLGYREYAFTRKGRSLAAEVVADSGLGILRDPDVVVFEELRALATMPAEVRAFVDAPGLMLVTKASRVSPVRRAVFMDAVLVKHLDAKGKVTGVRLYAGLFTAAAYNQSVQQIPLVREKVRRTIRRAGFRPGSHDGKVLLNILETFPRDELFQVPVEHLHLTGLGIKHLQERQRVALFIRRDDFERFISCLVYIPREKYSTELRRRLQEILEGAFAGSTLAFYTQLADQPLARLHVLVKTTAGGIPDYDAVEIENRLAQAARSWHDVLQEALITAYGEECGLRLGHTYRHAFRSGYRERFSAEVAVHDIQHVESVLENGLLAMNLYRPIEAAENQMRFKVYRLNRPIPLSDVLPMLEHLGLRVVDEIPYRVAPQDLEGRQVLMHDFGLESRDGADIDLGKVRENFQEAFSRVWCGEVESDGFNALVLKAGLGWREVVVLRAYAKFLRQTGIAFSQAYMEQTLANNPDLAKRIAALFAAHFDPKGRKDANRRLVRLREELNTGLDRVSSADEDRILRRFIDLVEGTLRTNHYQKTDDDGPKPYLSFKLDSRALDELPLPRPLVEIFVYSPSVEGVHLRFGKVARGGLRWSDRREDFRTEILGLVKAQVVKNAVIVPVGSKGGFVVKRPPTEGGREAFVQEGVRCYKTFIRGLLDLTDNLVGDAVISPKDVVKRDEDDPYLVVAADKGTATFSDIANSVSADYGFWLGDAFASGGSNGYDHKKMGITARGAWESVKRHFRELGTDIQTQDFTAVGVGDMAGDVFGNGMLLSPHTRLVGAFNHMHIFIDPDPDAASSFAERKRLFELPRSSWADYNATLISKGGGVFERRAKSITLTPEIKKRLDLKADSLTPAELIKALLRASVDLLWFGGIGTYVKASDEVHADTGDRSNDSLRIDAPDLRCQVVGEGANLGLTQKARIEFALVGGRDNPDFIDNAGGVNCSDHEVNIKILLDKAVANGDLTTKQRNNLLERMTDEVADLVLRDNYLQSQAITVVQNEGTRVLDDQIRFMRMLEKSGRLNRAVEFLPDDEELAERKKAGQALTRPEIAVVMSYAKIWLFDELLESPLPDDKELLGDLIRYFPQPIQKRYKAEIKGHRLKREIVATKVTNSLINRVGGTFVNRLMEKTGMTPGDIARAYTITREVFGIRDLWHAVEHLDNRVPAAAQSMMLAEINRLIERATLWFLRHGTRPLDIGHHVARFQKGVAALSEVLGDLLPEHYVLDAEERAEALLAQGVPEHLALRVAALVNLASAGDVVALAEKRGLGVEAVGRLYFAVGSRFRLGHLRASAEALVADTHWQKLAIGALLEEIYGHQAALADQVLHCSGNVTEPRKAIRAWLTCNHVAIERTELMLSELWGTDLNDYAQVAVASRQLDALAKAPPSASGSD